MVLLSEPGALDVTRDETAFRHAWRLRSGRSERPKIKDVAPWERSCPSEA
eukprot:CAMPEP_0175928250 /NCGR_PEP_ID=MMETSP0108-20121206/17151_1 /TAXON_ID=195067 ORGANISM="Goniomonas pacifica, Strain CCMP1869" /NCGR_SAMPLE_ID=MMETSP0108 /ASSEMBLY_ACC=CAM_ASM_000204 /LENGTH=49 /DNA_ID= /DNA_START= /DNA_END= /DNA_ORIENTATION=